MKLVIDIGSNTSKCLLAEKTSSGLNKLFELSLENRILMKGSVRIFGSVVEEYSQL